MLNTSDGTDSVQLVKAKMQGNGVHSSRHLTAKVRSGKALRVRRGVYVDANAWIDAPYWERYEIAVAATAMHRPNLIFCRETALLLHGLPMNGRTGAVMARTFRPATTGQRPAARLTEPLELSTFRDRYLRHHTAPQHFRPSDLVSIPTRYLEASLLSGLTRDELRSRITAGQYTNPSQTLPGDSLTSVAGPQIYHVEPLGLSLVDTVSRMDFLDAVVVLDAAKSRVDFAIDAWLPFLTSARRRENWDAAWQFADARAESPGESKSRALIHTLGFAPPVLQKTIVTDEGTFRPDFCWEDARIIGEFDGRTKYFDQRILNGEESRNVVYQEKLREDALRRAGWVVVRWGWDQLLKPEILAHYLRTAGVPLVNL